VAHENHLCWQLADFSADCREKLKKCSQGVVLACDLSVAWL